MLFENACRRPYTTFTPTKQNDHEAGVIRDGSFGFMRTISCS